jgi:hypothetical protein
MNPGPRSFRLDARGRLAVAGVIVALIAAGVVTKSLGLW